MSRVRAIGMLAAGLTWLPGVNGGAARATSYTLTTLASFSGLNGNGPLGALCEDGTGISMGRRGRGDRATRGMCLKWRRRRMRSRRWCRLRATTG